MDLKDLCKQMNEDYIQSFMNYMDSINQKEENTININKKLKGYQYDSLVLRYIVARKQMAEYERLKFKGDCSSKENNLYDKQANRDIMRFCQILNEVIGEHD